MTQEEMRIFHQAQIDEIYRFKWIMGIQMNQDPLNVYTLNDIAIMWIDSYAEGFRENWTLTHISGHIDGINN